MADTQEAPQASAGLQPIPALGGSVTEAQEALLSLMEPEEEKPKKEEAAPTEEEESTEETQDESLEEESEEEPAESDEDEEGESEESDEEEEEELVYAVTVNGEEQEVTLDELLKGYSRQSDYTRKTQDISEQRKQTEELQEQYKKEVAQIQTERGQYTEALQSVITASMAGAEKFANVDWDRLRAEDPMEYTLKKDEYRDLQDKVQQAQAEQQRVKQKQYDDFQQLQREHLVKEHKSMVEKMPEWQDAEKKKVIAKDIRNFAKTQGFQEEEIDGLSDHRSLIILHKALKYDALQKADVKSKKIKGKPRVVRSGKAKEKGEDARTARTAKMKRLRGTGHIDDASALLEDFVDI